MIDTDLLGYLTCSREAAVRFQKQKAGYLVNIGSMSTKVCEAGSDAHVAAKACIRGFIDSLAERLNLDGVRVTLIEPGLVGSDMTLDKVEKDQQAEAREK